MTFDLRAWALHDAVFQLARDSGLRSFRVECKLGPEGETIIALILAQPALGSARPADSRSEALAEPRVRDEYAATGRSARKRPAR
jgi:hypothetical protein